MAKHKAIKDADILQYDLIESRLTSKPSIKGIALSSSSIEEYEKYRANTIYEEDEVLVDCLERNCNNRKKKNNSMKKENK